MAVKSRLAAALLAAGACLLCAQEKKADAKNADEPKAPVRRPPRPIKIPEDAKEIRPGLWRAVDKSGQAWLYWNAPFGVVRSPEKPGDEIKPTMPAAEERKTEEGKSQDRKPGPVTIDNITVVDEGESLSFERRLPFGLHRWSRKKTELNEEERRIWERLQQMSGGAAKQAPTQAKPN
jgi:hypothetical protein